MSKLGTVITERVNLDLIDPRQTIEIGRPLLEVIGGVVTLAGVTSRNAVKIRRMALKGGGNQNNARWRTRRGGAWMSAINKKFKTGK